MARRDPASTPDRFAAEAGATWRALRRRPSGETAPERLAKRADFFPILWENNLRRWHASQQDFASAILLNYPALRVNDAYAWPGRAAWAFFCLSKNDKK
jgi:hypothetical protein